MTTKTMPTDPALPKAGFRHLAWLFLPLLPAVLAPLLLRGDTLRFLTWWAAISLPAILWFPSSARIFGFRADAGYLFAKPLSMAINSLAVWMLSYLHLLPFTRAVVLLALAGSLAANMIPARSREAMVSIVRSPRLIRQVAAGEFMFGCALLFATYARALKPAIESIPEKFMDYGFMMSLMRTDWLPAKDLWLAGESINYYYYGQYVYTFLTKMAGLTPAVTYNLGMATTFALTIVLSYAVVYAWTDRLLADRSRLREDHGRRHTAAPAIAGILAAVMVQIAGNSHSFFYDESSPGNAVLRVVRTLGIDVGTKINGFFFPDSTRFIGYNPDVPDKTIHEFPFYSFLVADLHPHLINLAFVFLLLGILLVLYRSDRIRLTAQSAWTLRARLTAGEDPAWLRAEMRSIIKRAGIWASEPSILITGVLLGIFTMCNFWDLAIYFAVAGMVLLISNLRGYGSFGGWESVPVFTVQMLLILLPFLVVSSPTLALVLYAVAFAGCCLLTLLSADALTMTGAQMALLFLLANFISLPFNLSFQPMSKEIALASSHTRIFQLLILWGVHVGIGGVFALRTAWSRLRRRDTAWPDAEQARGPVSRFFLGIRPIDLLVCGIFSCGVFLILLPELVFVVDIYRGAYSRANTMFKFTYQAFVLLSLVMAYATVRVWMSAIDRPEKRGRHILAVLTALALLIPLHYPFTKSAIAWSKDYAPSNFSGLDGSWQIGTIDSAVIPGSAPNELRDDLACISWFNETVSGQPAILEMFGKSYRDNCRISVFTGLPTVLGWETHEHLWRTSNQTQDAWGSVVMPRQQEILNFYAYKDESTALAFLKKYQVRYVVVGGMERAIAGRLVENDGFTHDAFKIADDRIRALGEIAFESDTLYVVRINENLLK